MWRAAGYDVTDVTDAAYVDVTGAGKKVVMHQFGLSNQPELY